MEAKRTYFPGLNALRFFAAILVVFHHMEQYSFWSGKSSFWGQAFIDALGHKTVGFFFVLSGFLITYLLLEEKRKNQSINVGLFYLKRVLRIWPLYFIIVIIALFVIPLFSHISFDGLPSPNTPVVWVALIFMLPNILRISFPTLIGGNQLWSVGIEEQFYLCWPLLIRKYADRVIPFLYAFIAIKIGGHLLLLAGLSLYDSSLWIVKIERLYALFPVEQMAVGGLGAAYLFYDKKSKIRLMGNKIVGCIALALIVGGSFVHIDFFLMPLVEAALFLIVIYQVTSTKYIYNLLEIKPLNYLGSISYGVYMWHTVAIFISITLFDVFSLSHPTLALLSSIALTIVFSALSYKYMEHPIQKLRNRSWTGWKFKTIRSVKHAKL